MMSIRDVVFGSGGGAAVAVDVGGLRMNVR